MCWADSPGFGVERPFMEFSAMAKVTVIWMGTNDPAKQNQRIDVADNATVRQALSQANVPTNDVLVNVNRVKGSLDQVVGANDMITVTNTNLKGAAEAVISFEDILAWGKGEPKVANDVLSKALDEVAKEGAEEHLSIVKDLVGTMKSSAICVNKQVAAAEKALVEAKERAGELAYATEQLRKGNIFSLLGFAGMKGYASEYCSRMGCEVPANNSPLWATSAPKAK